MILRVLIVLLDELVFRPVIAVMNWQPSKRDTWKEDPL